MRASLWHVSRRILTIYFLVMSPKFLSLEGLFTITQIFNSLLVFSFRFMSGVQNANGGRLYFLEQLRIGL